MPDWFLLPTVYHRFRTEVRDHAPRRIRRRLRRQLMVWLARLNRPRWRWLPAR